MYTIDMQNTNKIIDNKPLVSVDCITYNHEAYIRDALEGFLMQKTNFTLEVLIHDDASTDQTANIIRKYEKDYPNIIKPIYQKENQFSKGKNVFREFQIPRIRGKYIAICEGDDYWTDPLKLQKQVDFLENNSEYGLVYSNIDRLNEKTNAMERSVFNNQLRIINNTFEDFLINAWFLAPCTWMIRTEIYKKYEYLIKNEYVATDLAYLYIFSKNSKIHYYNESMAVYRALTNSASHYTNIHDKYNFYRGIFKIQTDFSSHYNTNLSVIEQMNCTYYLRIFKMACLLNDLKLKREAFLYLKKHTRLKIKKRVLYVITKFSVVRQIFIKSYFNY